MAVRNVRSRTTTTKIPADHRDHRDEEVMQALVTAGALVALADGRVEAAERDEFVSFVDGQGFVPTISRQEIAEAFGRRARQLEDRDSASVIVENLRPLAGLSLASVVVRTAGRVAAADRKIHPGELHAIRLIRLIMKNLSGRGSPASTGFNNSVLR